jgi:hypothetical protein
MSAISSSAGNPESVTHVLGHFCYLSLRLLRRASSLIRGFHVRENLPVELAPRGRRLYTLGPEDSKGEAFGVGRRLREQALPLGRRQAEAVYDTELFEKELGLAVI